MKNTTTIKTTIGISAITETIRTITTSIKRSLAHSWLHLNLNAWQFMWRPCAYAMAPAAAADQAMKRAGKHRQIKSLVGVTGACLWHAASARAERVSERS